MLGPRRLAHWLARRSLTSASSIITAVASATAFNRTTPTPAMRTIMSNMMAKPAPRRTPILKFRRFMTLHLAESMT